MGNKIFWLSDIHIGHSRTPAKITVDSIMKMVKDNIDKISSCNILALTGDITDKLLSTRSKDYGELLRLMSFLTKLCLKYDMWLLSLYGTPLHEMEQMGNVFNFLSLNYPELKYREYSGIGVDYIEELDLRIGYLSDIKLTNEEVYAEFDKLFIVKPDILLTHAFYTHHIDLPLPDLRVSDKILDYVIGPVLNGHDHRYTEYKSIITVGSTDRLAHNEEADKGCAIVSLGVNGVYLVERIINTNAVIYKTISINDHVRILEFLDSVKDKELVWLRVNQSIVKTVKFQLGDKYPNVMIEAIKKKQRKSKIVESTETDVLEITPKNVAKLLSERVKIPNIESFLETHIIKM